jgi:hypothetical protein
MVKVDSKMQLDVSMPLPIRNLIAGGPTDRGGGSDTILELRVRHNSTLQIIIII